MISFMIHQVSWAAVFVAALAGFGIGLVWHMIVAPLFYRFDRCKACDRCDKKEQHCCAEHGHDHRHHDFGGMLWYRLGSYAVYFAQAYGLAYFLERLNLLSDLADSIYLALFLGATFVVSQLFCKVLCHHKSIIFFVAKAAYKLFVLAVMAWVFVYWASMVAGKGY